MATEDDTLARGKHGHGVTRPGLGEGPIGRRLLPGESFSIEEVQLVVVLVADAVPAEEDELLGGGWRGTARVSEPS